MIAFKFLAKCHIFSEYGFVDFTLSCYEFLSGCLDKKSDQPLLTFLGKCV